MEVEIFFNRLRLFLGFYVIFRFFSFYFYMVAVGRYPYRHAFNSIAFKRATSSALINPLHEGLA